MKPPAPHHRAQQQVERLKSPDKKVLESILGLSGDPRFENIRRWVKDSLQEQRVKNDQLEGTAIYRGQGMALTHADLVEYLERPEDFLEDL